MTNNKTYQTHLFPVKHEQTKDQGFKWKFYCHITCEACKGRAKMFINPVYKPYTKRWKSFCPHCYTTQKFNYDDGYAYMMWWTGEYERLM